MLYNEVYDYLKALLLRHGVSRIDCETILRGLFGSILENDYNSFQSDLKQLWYVIKHLSVSPVLEIEIIEQIVRFLRIARKRKDISRGFYLRARRLVENLLKKREYVVEGIEEKPEAIEKINKKKLNEIGKIGLKPEQEVLFFLGAGASKPAPSNIPTVNETFGRVMEKIK